MKSLLLINDGSETESWEMGIVNDMAQNELLNESYQMNDGFIYQ